MKSVGRFFLVVNFFFAFISLLFAISFKFQFLDSRFWIKTFDKYQVYAELQKGVEKAITEQIVKEGGNSRQAKAIADLIGQNTLKDFVEKNITNLTGFLNANDENLNLYIPTKILPPGFLPKNLAIKNNEINLESLTSNLNTTPGQRSLNYKQLASTGMISTISLLIAIFFVALGLWGFYKSNDPDTKMLFPGGAIVATGIIVLILLGVLNVFRINMARELLKEGMEPVQILLGTLAPPIILEVSKLWAVICALTIVLGVGILFVKKPLVK